MNSKLRRRLDLLAEIGLENDIRRIIFKRDIIVLPILVAEIDEEFWTASDLLEIIEYFHERINIKITSKKKKNKLNTRMLGYYLSHFDFEHRLSSKNVKSYKIDTGEIECSLRPKSFEIYCQYLEQVDEMK